MTKPQTPQPFKRRKKVHTVVKFDEDARMKYLNNFVGAKRRRREYAEMKKLQTTKQEKRDDRKVARKERQREIEGIKEELRKKEELANLNKKEETTIKYKKGGQQLSITTTFM